MYKHNAQERVRGVRAAFKLSDKAFHVYSNTNPLNVYEVKTEPGPRYDIDGVAEISSLTFQELNDFLEAMYEDQA